jgi:hypothetical protein
MIQSENLYSIRTMTLSDYDECFELWNIKVDAVNRADSTNETFLEQSWLRRTRRSYFYG